MEVEHDQKISISRAEFKDSKNKSTYIQDVCSDSVLHSRPSQNVYGARLNSPVTCQTFRLGSLRPTFAGLISRQKIQTFCLQPCGVPHHWYCAASARSSFSGIPGIYRCFNLQKQLHRWCKCERIESRMCFVVRGNFQRAGHVDACSLNMGNQ